MSLAYFSDFVKAAVVIDAAETVKTSGEGQLSPYHLAALHEVFASWYIQAGGNSQDWHPARLRAGLAEAGAGCDNFAEALRLLVPLYGHAIHSDGALGYVSAGAAEFGRQVWYGFTQALCDSAFRLAAGDADRLLLWATSIAADAVHQYSVAC